MADIDASGYGFDGGKSNTTLPSNGSCTVDSFFYVKDAAIAAAKGNTYANLGDSTFTGKGKKGSGGGGGQGFSSGGGGGSNGGKGGTEVCKIALATTSLQMHVSDKIPSK